MEKSCIYSVEIGDSERLIGGVIEIKEKRKSYIFIGVRGIVLAVIPKEVLPLIFFEDVIR